jgi:outer membrane protein assembly factor BamA
MTSMLGVHAPARAQTSPIDRALGVPDSGVVVAVIFNGNNTFSDAVLQTVINTRVSSFLEHLEHTITLGAIGSGKIYTDQASRDRDTANIEEFYRENGFLFAHCVVEVHTDIEQLRQVELLDQQNRLLPRNARKHLPPLPDTVFFHINEGPVSNITGVSYSGLENLPTELQPELTEHSLIKLNVRYSSAIVLKEVSRVQAILGENGYPFFKYDSTATEHANDHNVDVHVLFYFETGNRYRFGESTILYDTNSSENRHVNESTVRSELDMVPGDWYKASVVQASQANLYRLENFEVARINFDTNKINAIPDSLRDGQRIDQIVQLRMRISQEIIPGFFIGEGQFAHPGIFTFSTGLNLNYTNHNTFGGAQNLLFQAVYQLLPSDETNRSANIDLTFPYRRIPIFSRLIPNITNSPLTVGAGYSEAAQKNRSDEVLYHVHQGINATIGDPNNHTSVVPDLLVEYVYRQYTAPRLSALYGASSRKQINTIFSLNGQWDRTNDFFNPTRGFYTGGTLEFASPILKSIAPADFGSADYLKEIVHLKDFIELQDHGRLVLGGRLRIGNITLLHPRIPVDPIYDAPLERRFYAGGGSSVRGWPNRALLAAPREDPNRTTDEGGYRLLEFNTELLWAPSYVEVPVTSKEKFLAPLRLALFFDAGQVWDEGASVNPKQIAMAIGTGVRYLTIFGAFRFDIGLRLYDPNPLWGTQQPAVTVAGSDPHGLPQFSSDKTYTYLSPAYPDTKGVWLFNRKFNFDAVQFQFNLGEAF